MCGNGCLEGTEIFVDITGQYCITYTFDGSNSKCDVSYFVIPIPPCVAPEDIVVSNCTEGFSINEAGPCGDWPLVPQPYLKIDLDQSCGFFVTVQMPGATSYNDSSYVGIKGANECAECGVHGTLGCDSTPQPTPLPTNQPTSFPTNQPTVQPTAHPTPQPTPLPTKQPTSNPTNQPTAQPTNHPTPNPTKQPTAQPTNHPTPNPTKQPTKQPTSNPTNQPTPNPTPNPTFHPTTQPTNHPTPNPTKQPTPNPTNQPTAHPTPNPTNQPTAYPTPNPTNQPTSLPTNQPTSLPTNQPTPLPTNHPTAHPTAQPTPQPTIDMCGDGCLQGTEIFTDTSGYPCITYTFDGTNALCDVSYAVIPIPSCVAPESIMVMNCTTGFQINEPGPCGSWPSIEPQSYIKVDLSNECNFITVQMPGATVLGQTTYIGLKGATTCAECLTGGQLGCDTHAPTPLPTEQPSPAPTPAPTSTDLCQEGCLLDAETFLYDGGAGVTYTVDTVSPACEIGKIVVQLPDCVVPENVLVGNCTKNTWINNDNTCGKQNIVTEPFIQVSLKDCNYVTFKMPGASTINETSIIGIKNPQYCSGCNTTNVGCL